MAETDTLERTKTVRLQVASLPPAEGGRGFARLSATAMQELGLSEGDGRYEGSDQYRRRQINGFHSSSTTVPTMPVLPRFPHH